MDECVKSLEKSPWVQPFDTLFCKHTRSQCARDGHSQKLFALHLFMPASLPSGPDTHGIINSFKRKLTSRDDLPPTSTSNCDLYIDPRGAMKET